jgi:DNA polymerase III subunit delta
MCILPLLHKAWRLETFKKFKYRLQVKMTEINYKEINKYLDKLSKKNFAEIYLIFGEELIYKKILKRLVEKILKKGLSSLNYEYIDGSNPLNIYNALLKLNTYSMFSDIKIIGLCDSKIFYTNKNSDKFFEKLKIKFDKEGVEKTARDFLSFLSIADISLNNFTEDEISIDKKEKISKDDAKWFFEISDYCIQKKLKVPSKSGEADKLAKALEKGFADGNHLIITTDTVDKRKKLFKILKNKGVIIDCQIPKGNTAKDRQAQSLALNERRKEIEKDSGKKIENNAYAHLCSLTGFDLSAFSDNMEKLVNFAGKRKSINIKDVESLVKRSKKDPVYELTGAISDRNLKNALFYLNSIISSDDFHPLQILASIINQIRKLLVIKSFIKENNTKWRKGLSFNIFKASVIKEIAEYDKKFHETLKNWNTALYDDEKTKKKISTSLTIAKNINNPYPVYQLFIKSENFKEKELILGLKKLGEADMMLKSSGQKPRLILEKVIISLIMQKN